MYDVYTNDSLHGVCFPTVHDLADDKIAEIEKQSKKIAILYIHYVPHRQARKIE